MINFSPYFVDYINTATECPDPTVKPHIVTITCPEDILACGNERKEGENEQTPRDPEEKV